MYTCKYLYLTLHLAANRKPETNVFQFIPFKRDTQMLK